MKQFETGAPCPCLFNQMPSILLSSRMGRLQEKFHAITYNPDLDKIVAVGEKGWRAYGSNPEDMSGVSWYLDQSVRYMGITYGKNSFITVGERGALYTSPDGCSERCCCDERHSPRSTAERRGEFDPGHRHSARRYDQNVYHYDYVR